MIIFINNKKKSICQVGLADMKGSRRVILFYDFSKNKVEKTRNYFEDQERAFSILEELGYKQVTHAYIIGLSLFGFDLSGIRRGSNA